MKHSAGIIIYDKDIDSVLLGHQTGHIEWGLFKGGINPGERPVAAAARELLEESNISVPLDRVIDLGLFNYIRGKKDLYLFLYITSATDEIRPDIATCKCVSFFMKHEYPFPEMDGFKWFKCNELHSFVSENMYMVISKALHNYSRTFKK